MKYISKEEVMRIIKEYVDKGERCMNQSIEQEDYNVYTFWDGFHNCAENILEEIKNIQ